MVHVVDAPAATVGCEHDNPLPGVNDTGDVPVFFTVTEALTGFPVSTWGPGAEPAGCPFTDGPLTSIFAEPFGFDETTR